VERTDNKVETLPEALGILTNLEVIDACRNKIGSVKSLGPLHNLVTLKLDQNEISSLSLMQVIALEFLLQTYFLTGTLVHIVTLVRAVEEADATQTDTDSSDTDA
jgi:Leucine-rich repeat (LRR) protein